MKECPHNGSEQRNALRYLLRIRYGGRWKVLQYFATHFYSPLLVSAFLDANLTAGGVWVVNDGTTPRNGTVSLTLVSWTDGIVVALSPVPFTVSASSSVRVVHFNVSDLLALAPASKCASPSACFLSYNMTADSELPSAGLHQQRHYTDGLGKGQSVLVQRPAGQSFLLLGSVKPGQAVLLDPLISVTSVTLLGPQDGYFEVRILRVSSHGCRQDYLTWNFLQINITAAAPAVFIWLETPLRGIWSDNAIAMFPFEMVHTQKQPVARASLLWRASPDGATPSAAELAATLRCWSLFDIWAGRPLPISVLGRSASS